MVDDEIRSLFIDALYETLRYDEKKQATANLMPVSVDPHLEEILQIQVVSFNLKQDEFYLL